MRYRVILVGVGAVLLLCSVAWYLRPVIAAHRIGIPWRATLRQSHCVRGPFGEFCTTNWPLHPDPRLVTTLNIDPLTRTLLRADRSWSLRDATVWAHVMDSTQHALTAQGWEQLPCDTAITHFPIAEAWRVGNREVQLYAAPAMNVRRSKSAFSGASCRGTRPTRIEFAFG